MIAVPVQVMIELFPTDGFLTRMNRGLWCHMCPIKTHVTNLLISVISRIGNSFGLSRSVIKPNLLFTSEMLLFTGWRLQMLYIRIGMMNATLYLKIEDLKFPMLSF